jgi:hypothetical protein
MREGGISKEWRRARQLREAKQRPSFGFLPFVLLLLIVHFAVVRITFTRVVIVACVAFGILWTFVEYVTRTEIANKLSSLDERKDTVETLNDVLDRDLNSVVELDFDRESDSLLEVEL